MITLAQLLPPITADDVKAVLLSALSGIGPVQQIGQGSGVIVAAGTPSPTGNYDVIVAITAAGSPGGTLRFTYSLDGGVTTNGPQGVGSNGVFAVSGAGVTITFAGTFNLGDQYLFQTVWPPFPVTDWSSGSGGRTFTEAEAATIADFAGTAIPAVAAGGLVDYADENWITLLSDQLYENDRFQPVTAQGQAEVTLASTATSKTFAANQLVIANAPGSGPSVFTFSNVNPFTITPGQTLLILFQASQPGADFNLQNGTVTTVQTPAAGLLVANPAPGISAVTPSGGATGSLTVSGAPQGNFSIVVSVLSTGGAGVGSVQVSIDGGVNYESPFTIPVSGAYPLPQPDGLTPTGLTLNFAGTFTSGDSYSFTAYAQWILVAGQDLESRQALQARDKNKWTALSLGGGTRGTFDYLCRSAPGGSEVTKTSASADGSTPGKINVVVAGFNGPVSAAALASITTYVQQRTGLTMMAAVSNAGSQAVPVVASVYVPAAQLPAAQAAISVAFEDLTTVTPIGGKIFWSDILEALDQKNAGVRNVVLTTPAPNTDTQLSSTSVPAFGLTLSYVLI